MLSGIKGKNINSCFLVARELNILWNIWGTGMPLEPLINAMKWMCGAVFRPWQKTLNLCELISYNLISGTQADKNFWGVLSLVLLNPHTSRDQAHTCGELLSAWCPAGRNGSSGTMCPPISTLAFSHPPLWSFSPGPRNPASQASPLRCFQSPWFTLELLLVAHWPPHVPSPAHVLCQSRFTFHVHALKGKQQRRGMEPWCELLCAPTAFHLHYKLRNNGTSQPWTEPPETTSQNTLDPANPVNVSSSCSYHSDTNDQKWLKIKFPNPHNFLPGTQELRVTKMKITSSVSVPESISSTGFLAHL